MMVPMYSESAAEKESECLCVQSMTAKEMDGIPHQLSDKGMTATTDRLVYKWDARFSHWTPWKSTSQTTTAQNL